LPNRGSTLRSPREALLATLECVLAKRPDAGLRIVKSGPLLKTSDRDFPGEIFFSGNRWNRTVHLAEFSMSAAIHARGMKAWRKAQRLPVGHSGEHESAFLAAKAFSDSRKSFEYYSWDVRGIDVRQDTVDGLVSTIRNECLPWLEACRDPETFRKSDWHGCLRVNL